MTNGHGHGHGRGHGRGGHRRRSRTPTQPQAPAVDVPRAAPAQVVAGPTNAIWLISTDYVLPNDGHRSEAAMWWKYANRSDNAATGPVHRMSADARATSVDLNATTPATLRTLASLINATSSVAREDLVFYWHGHHLTNTHPDLPYQLHDKDEEYYGSIHRYAPPGPLPPRPSDDATDLATWQVYNDALVSQLHIPRSLMATEYSDLSRLDERSLDVVTRARQARRDYDKAFPFNWPGGRGVAAPDWPGRHDNANYMAVIRAIHNHPTVRRIHLLGCDLADLRFMKPIFDLTNDIANGDASQGDSRVENKEVWAYQGLTTTAWEGDHLYISPSHSSNTPSLGAYQDDHGDYHAVWLYTERGVLPGWQTRGRVSGGSVVVEKFVHIPPRRRGAHVYKVEIMGESALSRQQYDSHDRPIASLPYTPDREVTATPPPGSAPTPHFDPSLYPAQPRRRRGSRRRRH